MSGITIYHNPRCGTSRNTLAMIRNSGAEPAIIEYLQHPPTREQLRGLAQASGVGVRGLVRAKEPLYAELGLDAHGGRTDRGDAGASGPDQPADRGDAAGRALVQAFGSGAGDPAEPQQGAFAREDGEQVVGADGGRV